MLVAPSTVSVENVPGAQPAHALDPAAAVYEPAGQMEQVVVAADVFPAGPYLPAAQDVPAQTLSATAPGTQEYLPAAHSVQLLDEEDENAPAEHKMQIKDVEAPVAAEYVPAAHSVHALAPDAGEYLPVVHSVQLLAPEEEDEHEPGAQGWGWACPPEQDFPLGHAVPADESVPRGQ